MDRSLRTARESPLAVLHVDNPRSLYEHLKAAGIEPDGPPKLQEFGRTQFRVRDPDGNILEFDTT